MAELAIAAVTYIVALVLDTNDERDHRNRDRAMAQLGR
jgi:hypothetical protein